MDNEYLLKLASLLKIEPVKENEAVIRNLSHMLLNDIDGQNEDGSLNASEIRKECLRHLRRLQINKIMGMESDDCRYLKYNVSWMLFNICSAFNVLMTKSDIYTCYNDNDRIFALCDAKLILYAISGIIRVFSLYGCGGEIKFSIDQNRSQVILSAFCREITKNNENHEAIQDEINALCKNAKLHSGTFFIFFKEGLIEATMTMKAAPINVKISPEPHYIDMLDDKDSDIYICLSFLDD